MRNFTAQKLLVAIERCNDLGETASAERHHVDGGELEVRRHPHFGHSDDVAFERRIVHAALSKNVRNGVADDFANAQLSLRPSRRYDRREGRCPFCVWP